MIILDKIKFKIPLLSQLIKYAIIFLMGFNQFMEFLQSHSLLFEFGLICGFIYDWWDGKS